MNTIDASQEYGFQEVDHTYEFKGNQSAKNDPKIRSQTISRSQPKRTLREIKAQKQLPNRRKRLPKITNQHSLVNVSYDSLRPKNVNNAPSAN